MANKSKEFLENLLSKADIKINGDRPWDIRVKDERFYGRVIAGGSLALGESYMDDWWECEHIDQLIDRALLSGLHDKVSLNLNTFLSYLRAVLFNQGSVSKAFDIAEAHYDTGNHLFERMLDKRLVYTCAYWKGAKTLDEAQENKLDLVCRKLDLKPGQKILDIGCGFGSFAKYAAEKYGVSVVGITVSEEQAKLARELCKGLPIEIRMQDYREVNEKFDHIASIGMFEQVGVKNYDSYMKVVDRCLSDDGLFLLHTIGGNRTAKSADPWLGKYIFPGGMLPSIRQMGKSIEGLFVMEDWHNIGADYDKTLLCWLNNFDLHWDELKAEYGERFYRMWKYYLLLCAGCFRARYIQLWQIVLSKKGVRGGYNSVR